LKRYLWIAGLISFVTFVSSCSDDPSDPSPQPPAEAGTIVIDASPDGIVFPWTLLKPDGATRSGNGGSTLTDAEVGSYTLTWGDVAGRITPPSQTKALTDGATVSFTTTYQELQAGYIVVPAGTFQMGSPESEVGRGGEETRHEVTLTRPYMMKETPMTQAEYETVMGTNPSANGDCPDCPVENVSFYDALAFCNAKSAADGLTAAYVGAETSWTWDQDADGWRLPTEAEWEYACRAGTQMPFYTGMCLNADTHANYRGYEPYPGCAEGANRDQTVPVDSFPPNNWGFYDMAGNTMDWCWDLAGYYSGDETDPTGAASGSDRIYRGGSWIHYATACRCAARDGEAPGSAFDNVGFRVVRTLF